METSYNTVTDYTFNSDEKAGDKKEVSKEKFDCDLCGKRFSFHSNLKRHIRLHIDENSSTCVCNICGKKLSCLYNLKIHKNIHNSEMRPKCQICGKTFLEKRYLKLHSYTHTDEEPHFKCDICSKGYFRMSLLTQHMKQIHGPQEEKNKRFSKRSDPCAVCDKTFCDPLTLQRHMQIHTGDKPVECPTCEKQFFSFHSLKRHTFRKHNPERNKDAKCTECMKVFKTMGGLKRHMNRMHKNSQVKDKDTVSDQEINSIEQNLKQVPQADRMVKEEMESEMGVEDQDKDTIQDQERNSIEQNLKQKPHSTMAVKVETKTEIEEEDQDGDTI